MNSHVQMENVEEISGSVAAEEIAGSVATEEIGGSVTAKEINGSVTAEEINGSVATTEEIDGSIVDFGGNGGTNVVCVDAGSGSYKWDVLTGTIDLTELTADEVQTLWNSF